MASRKLLAPRTAVYQDGRGSEPMMEVGSVFPAEALNIVLGSFSISTRNTQDANIHSGRSTSRTAEQGNLLAGMEINLLGATVPAFLRAHDETAAPSQDTGINGCV